MKPIIQQMHLLLLFQTLLFLGCNNLVACTISTTTTTVSMTSAPVHIAAMIIPQTHLTPEQSSIHRRAKTEVRRSCNNSLPPPPLPPSSTFTPPSRLSPRSSFSSLKPHTNTRAPLRYRLKASLSLLTGII